MTEILVCHYCQFELIPGSNPATRDHIVPVALGGVTERWNLTPACRDCNSSKGDKYPTCACAKCARSRRRHWEMFRIPDETKPRNKAVARARVHSSRRHKAA